MYDFSATFLMKTDYDGFVKVSLKRNEVTISKSTLNVEGNAKGKIGTTSSLSAVLSLLKGDKVFLELEAEGEGGKNLKYYFNIKVCLSFSASILVCVSED